MIYLSESKNNNKKKRTKLNFFHCYISGGHEMGEDFRICNFNKLFNKHQFITKQLMNSFHQ